MKFLALAAETQQDSGYDKEQFYQKCKLILGKRYPTFGNFDNMCLCKEDLQEKPKYMAYCKVIVGRMRTAKIALLMPKELSKRRRIV
jgi:hypothetical protein